MLCSDGYGLLPATASREPDDIYAYCLVSRALHPACGGSRERSQDRADRSLPPPPPDAAVRALDDGGADSN